MISKILLRLAFSTVLLTSFEAQADIYAQRGYAEGQDGILLLTEKCPSTSELQVAVARVNGRVLEGCYVMNNRGNPVVKWSSGHIEELDGKYFQIKKTTPPPDVALLIKQEEQLNNQCRDGSGDLPATMEACNQRETLLPKIAAKGWCWGKDGQFGYEKNWSKCKQKLAFTKPTWCSNAKLPHEITICSDPQLSENEQRILWMYSEYSKFNTNNQSSLKEHKLFFVNKTSVCKTNKECIASAQLERINFYSSHGISDQAQQR